jgi:ATP-dependent helicase/DNAse subunit B
MENPDKVKRFLSASRIKQLETCSWQYWAKYHLSVPDKSNAGALRGTCCHLIFELLLNKRHKHHFDKILSKNSITGSPAINRLVIKNLINAGIYDEENYQMVDEMIIVGLKNDFYGEPGAKIDGPEQEFEIVNEKPEYRIKGFIDKPIQYPKDKTVRIVDYKSSKAKFKGDDLTANTQGMMYSLAARKLWPKQKRYIVDFLFLRFPKQPVQSLEFTKDQLLGFELYLEHVNKIVDEFNEEKAKSNYAADKEKSKWLCSAGKWVCPVKNPFSYFGLYNDKNELVKTSLTNNFSPKEGEKVKEIHYSGCPKFSQSQDNLFDF